MLWGSNLDIQGPPCVLVPFSSRDIAEDFEAFEVSIGV